MPPLPSLTDARDFDLDSVSSTAFSVSSLDCVERECAGRKTGMAAAVERRGGQCSCKEGGGEDDGGRGECKREREQLHWKWIK